MTHAIILMILHSLLTQHAIEKAKMEANACEWRMEVGLTVDNDNSIHMFIGRRGEVEMKLSPRTVVMIHTHPTTFTPSLMDIHNAIATKVPSIIISPVGMDVIFPDGTVEQFYEGKGE